MTAISFDTHKLIRALRDAGLPENQAEAISEGLANALDESTSATLATKADINRLEARIADIKFDLIKWIAGMLLAQAALVATLVKLL